MAIAVVGGKVFEGGKEVASEGSHRLANAVAKERSEAAAKKGKAAKAPKEPKEPKPEEPEPPAPEAPVA